MKHRAPAEEDTPAAAPVAPAASVPLAPPAVPSAPAPWAPAPVPSAPVPAAPAHVPAAQLETLPARPVPDLGFFAVPSPRGGSSSFGGGSSFTSPPAAQQRGTAPGRFDGVAGNQFGGAPTDRPFGSAELATLGAGAPPGFSAPSLQSKNRSFPGGRALVRIGGTLLVLVVLGAFGVGRLTWVAGFLAGDLKAPETLAGIPRLTGPEAERAEKEGAKMMTGGTGEPLVAVYTNGVGYYALIAQRGKTDIESEFRMVGIDMSQVRKVGESSCATAPDATSMCVHTSRTLTVWVAGSGAIEQVAAAVDEAWDKV